MDRSLRLSEDEVISILRRIKGYGASVFVLPRSEEDLPDYVVGYMGSQRFIRLRSENYSRNRRLPKFDALWEGSEVRTLRDVSDVRPFLDSMAMRRRVYD